MITSKDSRLPAWQVARQDPEKFNRALAVGRIFNKSTQFTGTAFRVGPGNHMMANAHVLSSGNPRDYRVEFTDANGRVTGVDGDRLLAFSPYLGQKNPRPDLRTRPNLDFALFTINPSQFANVKKFGYLELDPAGARPGQEMYIPQHGDVKGKFPPPKTFSVSDHTGGPQTPARINLVYPERADEPQCTRQTVQYSAQAEHGASGAPVISADTHKVIALHVGRKKELPLNVAANMSAIWQQVKGFFSNAASGNRPAAATNSGSRPEQDRQYQIGDRRNDNGTLQELWKNPSGGERWVDVWQSKDYAVGALVVLDGDAFAYRGPVAQGASPWAPAFDPKQAYLPNEQVYYYGRIVDATQLTADLARLDKGGWQRQG